MRKKVEVLGLLLALVGPVTFLVGEEKTEAVNKETPKSVAKSPDKGSPAVKVVKRSITGKYAGAIAPHRKCAGCHTSAVIEKKGGKCSLSFNVHSKNKPDKKYSMQGSVLKNGAVLFESGKIILVAKDGKMRGGIVSKKGTELAGIKMAPATAAANKTKK